MPRESAFDFSGMDAFWRVFERLRSNMEPTPDEWTDLFATPGYQALVRQEFKRESLEHLFRLAFKPSLDTQRRQVQRRDRLGILQHLSEVAHAPDTVKRQQENLESDALYWQERALEICLEWLPLQGARALPPVAFVIFQNDARGYIPVVFDLLASAKLGDLFPLLLAHEYHHVFRRGLMEVDYHLVGLELRDLLWVLDQIHLEGVADQIDKPTLMARYHPLVVGFSEAVTEAPGYLEQMNRLLLEVAAGRLSAAAAGERLRAALPRAGHPIGYHMAQVISRALGTRALVATVGNPFAFFRLYQEALTRLQEPGGFAPAVHDYLRSLESSLQVR